MSGDGEGLIAMSRAAELRMVLGRRDATQQQEGEPSGGKSRSSND